MIKQCHKCYENKNISEFYYSKHVKRHSHFCKTCHKNNYLQRKYNITLQELEQLIVKQKEQCAICNKNLEKSGNTQNSLNVDHCHKTGKVRGLLCKFCNQGLGHAQNDIFILQKIIQYLKTHE